MQLREPVDDAQAVACSERQDEVAHDAARIHLALPQVGLALRHERDGAGGDGKVVRPPRIARGERGRKEFEVGQPYVYVSVQRAERGEGLVGVRVVHDGDLRAADAEGF